MSFYWKRKIEDYFYLNRGYLLTRDGIKYRWRDLYSEIINFGSFIQSHQLQKEEIVSIEVLELKDFLMAFFGCLYWGITPILHPPGDVPDWVNQFRKISSKNRRLSLESHHKSSVPILQSSSFFLFTSGTSSHRKCVGLNPENLEAIYRTHIPRINFHEGITLSTLPFTHVFGLVMDLFLSLELKKSIIRLDYSDLGRSISSLGRERFSISGVPLLFEILKEQSVSLSNACGGIVGGAPISGSLSNFLHGTKIQVGYGQTEASPGIFLGKPGEFYSGYLGREIGISTKMDNGGQLCFKGENAIIESLSASGLKKFSKERWVETGDLVRKEHDKYFYIGRIFDSFKLSNGRMFSPEELERRIFDEFRIKILLFALGEDKILLSDTDESIVKKLIPNFLTREKIKIYPVSKWSKDKKGMISRKTMVQLFKQNNIL